jgi:hypothetical protein
MTLRGRFRGPGEVLLLWLALAAGIGRTTPASPIGSGIPESVRSYLGSAADTISLPILEEGRARALVFLPQGAARNLPAPPLDRFGRILWSGPHAAILDYDPARSADLTDSYEILPFPGESRPPRPRVGLPAPPAEPSPRIASAVAEVDSARLEETVADLVAFGSRRSNEGGGFDAGAFVFDRFQSLGLSDVTYFDYNEWCDDVVAVQPGLVRPDRIYVIGAHYDSITRQGGSAPGADDNASGTSGLLEVARVLSRLQFESTIIYIAFSGEEEGLVGSSAWATWAADHGLDIRAMVNLDMLGYVQAGDAVDLDLITNGLYPDLESFTTETIATYLPDFSVVSGYLNGGTSDQASFWGIGVPAIFFFEDSDDYSPYIHTTQDLIGLSLNDFSFMRRNVQSAAAVIATLANPVGVTITHVPIVDPAESVSLYPIRARIASLAPLDEDSLFVRYRVDGGPFEFLPLAAGGDSGGYETDIPRQPAGSRVEYSIHARDTDGLTGDDPPGAPAHLHPFEVGYAAVFSDRFEQDCGWTVGAPGDSATSGIWVRGRPIGTGAQPGADADGDTTGLCFFTGNGTPGGDIGEQDVDNGRTTLTSPRIDLTRWGRVRVEYARWFVDETRLDDTLRVFISNDDGSHWRLLEEVGGSEQAWKRVRFDSVDTLLAMTDSMRLRFVAEDRGGPSLVEGAIDDFRVKGILLPIRRSAERSIANLLVRAAPNPFRAATTVYCDLASPARPVIRVFDLRGRLVAAVDAGPRGAGRTEIVWNGRDRHDRSVPSGVYFLRLESAPGSTDRAIRVVKVR